MTSSTLDGLMMLIQMMSQESKDEGENDDHPCNKAGPCLMTDDTLVSKLGSDREDYVKPAEQS